MRRQSQSIFIAEAKFRKFYTIDFTFEQNFEETRWRRVREAAYNAKPLVDGAKHSSKNLFCWISLPYVLHPEISSPRIRQTESPFHYNSTEDSLAHLTRAPQGPTRKECRASKTPLLSEFKDNGPRL